MSPSASLDPPPEKATARGGAPEVGVAEARATGGWLGSRASIA